VNPVKRKTQDKEPAVRRYAVVLEYDGSVFAGWQYQANAHTVQAALEAAIRTRFGEQPRVGGASRTDSGVHARGQVAVFDLAHPIPASRLVPALNSTLPPAVRVLKAKRVAEGWDPRRASSGKTYSYLIQDRLVSSPLWTGRVWQVYQRLDLAAMRRAASTLLGRHDFSSFRASGCVARHPIRTVRNLTVSRQNGLIRIRITADAFLYHMVRNIVGTLVEIGRDRIPVSQMAAILKAGNRKAAGPTAPAQGLYLDKIYFQRRSA